ncbi:MULTISPECIES: SDR family oxidoreductase [Caballeronia]|jgi:NAD(P)-dependent dehydrogenase (short-subunit alcohol dehydrogenase family)|uniref:Short-chain dehydrogenase n=1 Tax=Caballeronia zhejiangensis TaxID=871203 RepID=A0A656QPC2_9BURK|nr:MULTISPECIES: SDR family oxidoreductase [Caballeronia]EKS70603.1 short chain dehydrogenase [Burkholderia sp. SJ98]KDR33659.1 short-chain dehydrogenase [Caballeronia zhejiangensis]MCG7403414.1 SDR family oxidoreductase [Caballeronia zhejiangensis]MCI1045755.1 SDR family oxidoreductase [Caballeronia zhejiangensis]MDR5766517.1 SDR family oxidoreductase [Caballeronia sp. LZ028]
MRDASKALDGRRVIVTGGARGLGAAFVRALVGQGAHVAFGDVLSEEGEALARELRDVHFFPLDLNEPRSIAEFVEQGTNALGGLDALINNAAITNSGGKSASELTPQTWDAVMNVNVRGTWLMSVACLPHLKDSGRGAIVNIASDTALWGAPKLLAYVASKGAVIAMTRSLAREFGADNVTVNAIAPGLTEVEATAYVPAERHEYYLKGRALTRAQVPDDVNGPVLFLLSDAARFVTGQLLPVNGGFVMN